jgi:hypothetical protein
MGLIPRISADRVGAFSRVLGPRMYEFVHFVHPTSYTPYGQLSAPDPGLGIARDLRRTEDHAHRVLQGLSPIVGTIRFCRLAVDGRLTGQRPFPSGVSGARKAVGSHSIRLRPQCAAFMAPMLWRLPAFPDFCESCLPSPIERPPTGSDWIRENMISPPEHGRSFEHSP